MEGMLVAEAQTLHLLPSVHRNGTSLDVLQDNAREALDAMQEAITAYRLTVPNGRDYYQLGPDAIARATKIYERNLGELERIASDLMALQEHLADYGDAHG